MPSSSSGRRQHRLAPDAAVLCSSAWRSGVGGGPGAHRGDYELNTLLTQFRHMQRPEAAQKAGFCCDKETVAMTTAGLPDSGRKCPSPNYALTVAMACGRRASCQRPTKPQQPQAWRRQTPWMRIHPAGPSAASAAAALPTASTVQTATGTSPCGCFQRRASHQTAATASVTPADQSSTPSAAHAHRGAWHGRQGSSS